MEEIVSVIESGKGELIGVTCEKPLGRNVKEAKKVLELTQRVGLLDGYLENQVFAPSLQLLQNPIPLSTTSKASSTNTSQN